MATKVKPDRTRAAASASSTPGIGAAPENPLLPNEKLKQLYLAMLKCRTLAEDRRLTRHHTGTGGKPSAQSMEAVLAGIALDLLPGDTVAPSKFDLFTGLIKALSSGPGDRALLGNLLSSVNASRAKGQPGKPALQAKQRAGALDSALVAHLNLATGMALAHALASSKNIAVAFADVDAASPGSSPESWREALHFAGTRKLPAIYVCQYRQSASSSRAGGATPRSKSKQPSLSDIAQSCGIPAIAVDANDVVAVYRVAQEAIQRARNGDGAALIECVVMPGGRSRSANSARSNGNRRGSAHESLSLMEQYLTRKGLFSDSWKQKHLQAFHKDLDAALKAVSRADRKPQRKRPR